MKHKEFVKLFGVPDDEEILMVPSLLLSLHNINGGGLETNLYAKYVAILFSISYETPASSAYHCSLKEKGKVLTEGHIYLSQNYACFYAHFLGRERKIVIKWEDVTSLERRSSAKIIPNAILFVLKGDKQILFRNFLNRHEAFIVMTRLWKKKQLNVQSGEIAKLTQRKDWNKQLREAMKLTAGRYEVVDKLGEGGFGLTFVVLDKEDFRHYVLKEICCETENEARDALKEMVLLRLLRHPYVVKYKDFWQEELHVFIVMEYCQGGDVGEVIEEGAFLLEKRVMIWTIQILLALTHMHSMNVLHRDIKPQNLFLNKWKDIKMVICVLEDTPLPNLTSKLGDFGLSTVRKNKKKQFQTAVGTLGYAAPELLKGKAYNEKCDMFALGCTLYEILTLRSVYDDDKAGIFPVPLPQPPIDRNPATFAQQEPERRPAAKDLLNHPYWEPELKTVRIQSEIYAELQQREEENEELRTRMLILQGELKRLKPNTRVLATSEANLALSSSILPTEDEDDIGAALSDSGSLTLQEEGKKKGKEKVQD